MLTACLVCSQLSMEKVQAMAEQVEIKAKVVQTEVKALVLRHKKALEERECELLWKVSRCSYQKDHLLHPSSSVLQLSFPLKAFILKATSITVDFGTFIMIIVFLLQLKFPPQNLGGMQTVAKTNLLKISSKVQCRFFL